MRKILFGALLAILAVIPVAWGMSTDIYVVCNLRPDGDNFLALRERPDAGSPMLLKLTSGTRLEEWDRSGEWMQVDALIDGRPGGYVHSTFACLVEDH